MKPVFNSLVLFFAFCPIYSLADVVKYDSAWGQNCHPSEESYAVKMKNVGDKPVDFKVCLEKKGGGWSCFVSNYVQPGAIEPKSWGYMTCRATGEVKRWWRNAGEFSDPVPNP